MKMKQITVYISWSGDNFVAGTDQMNGTVFVTHKRMDAVKADFLKAFNFHIQSSLEDGDSLPKYILEGNYQIIFEYMISAIFHQYEQFISLAALHKVTGINEQLLSHYKSGLKIPRPAQRKKIIEGIHCIGKELLSVV